VDWQIEYSPDGMQGPWEPQGVTAALGQTEALETLRGAAAGGALPSGYYRVRPVDEERWRIFRWGGSGRFELAYG
jgi:hypothetical protein